MVNNFVGARAEFIANTSSSVVCQAGNERSHQHTHPCDISQMSMKECAVHLSSAVKGLLGGVVSNLPSLPPPFSLPVSNALPSPLFGCNQVCERYRVEECERAAFVRFQRTNDANSLHYALNYCKEALINCYTECGWMGFNT